MPPYTKAQAKKHTQKADTSKKQKVWKAVATSAAKKGASEGSAIRQANAVVKKIKKR